MTVRAIWRESHATGATAAGAVAGALAALVVRAPIVAGAALGGLWGAIVALTAHHLAARAGFVWGALFGVAVWIVDRLADAAPGLGAHVVWGALTGAGFHYVRLGERRRHRRRAQPTADRR